jgi:tricorn protease
MTLASISAWAQPRGYYRSPALTDDSVIFTAEGDLWRAPLAGGAAVRLTTHPGVEIGAVVSPDGATVAFSGQYEGPGEVYTMPVIGGATTRVTYVGFGARPASFTPGGELVVATRTRSGPWSTQLIAHNLADHTTKLLPLSEAASASFDATGGLYFTKPDFQGSHTRRYRGGTQRRVWFFPLGAVEGGGSVEAAPITKESEGESHGPMWWEGRVYFLSDRAGVTNIWSMLPDGSDARAHTLHDDLEVRSASLRGGRIAYQHGADLWLLELGAGAPARRLDITLTSDMDQTRERWIDKPWDFLTSAHISHDAEHVALTSRGRVIVAPRRFGRLIEAHGEQGVRARDARFMPDGSVLAIADRSGETELWSYPVSGVGESRQLTRDAVAQRVQGIPSPDGTRIAHHDKLQKLWVLDVASGTDTLVDENPYELFSNLAWSPDSRFFCYVNHADNLNPVIMMYSTIDGSRTALTTDRAASYSPAWDPAGSFLYFLSERHLQSVTTSPWGLMAPEPFFDKRTKVFALALRPGLRSPFEEPDEVFIRAEKAKKDAEQKEGGHTAAPDESKPDKELKEDAKPKPVEIDVNAIATRIIETPIPAGNLDNLFVNDKALFFTDIAAGPGNKPSLKALAIDADAHKKREYKVETILESIDGVEMSGDGKALLVRKGETLAVIDAAPAKIEDLSKHALKLDGWKLRITPRDEWRQMYDESWRLLRDYFYDRSMHGVDWSAVREKYRPLIDRVASRDDLADVMAQMTAELSALHHFVRPGDVRSGKEDVANGSLGAELVRDDAAGGYRIDRVFRSDPDRPDKRSPLARDDLDIRAGDIIEMVNGTRTLSVDDIASLLRNQAGKQVLLRVKRPGEAQAREVIVKAVSAGAERDMRYHEWIEQRRALVEEWGQGRIGYVYLAAMGREDIADFARQYYPVFHREALIIDVRNNNGGNIDPWVLTRLLRKPWMYWSGAVGKPIWGMQYSFRGHMATICDEWTASDGEAFTEGFKRLGLGKVIGTRTWGGEIWLSAQNFVVDNGIATAGESGVFGPAGEWMIEGHGVEPDIVVENPPHATFKGEDAQLKATVEHLLRRLKDEPVPPVEAPKKPDKSR